MGHGRICAALALALLAGCSASGTTVTVLVRSDSVHALQSLDVSAHAIGANGFDQMAMAPLHGAGLKLPGRVVVEVPPQAISVTITLTGVDENGASFAVGGTAVIAANRDVQLPLSIGGPAVAGDGGVDLGVTPAPLDGGVAVDMTGCGVCNAPQLCCGNKCVDPSSDPNNCGGCGVVCGSGACGTTVSASMAQLPPKWSFNVAPGASTGSFYDATKSVAVVTNDSVGAVGSILFQDPLVADGLVATFDFRVTHAASPYGDGLGFVLIRQNAAVARIDTAVGITGGGLGMMAPTANGSSTVLTGYGVEFDSFDNDQMAGNCGETINGDHVNIDTLAQCFIAAGSVPTPLGTPQATTLGDGNWHTAEVRMSGGKMSLSITTAGTTKALLTDVPLTGFKTGDVYYLGFTGACGGTSERAEIRNVSFVFPTTRCL